jgi:hypothetical protein
MTGGATFACMTGSSTMTLAENGYKNRNKNKKDVVKT